MPRLFKRPKLWADETIHWEAIDEETKDKTLKEIRLKREVCWSFRKNRDSKEAYPKLSTVRYIVTWCSIFNCITLQSYLNFPNNNYPLSVWNNLGTLPEMRFTTSKPIVISVEEFDNNLTPYTHYNSFPWGSQNTCQMLSCSSEHYEIQAPACSWAKPFVHLEPWMYSLAH